MFASREGILWIGQHDPAAESSVDSAGLEPERTHDTVLRRRVRGLIRSA